MAVRPKDRIVAKSGRPARREDQDPVHAALESFVCAIRPGERQHADESRPPRRRGRALPEFALDARHGGAKVFRPARPISPNRCRAPRRARRRKARNRRRAQASPEACAAARAFSTALSRKVDPVSSGSSRPSAAAPSGVEAEGPQQLVDLAQLAGVVGGDDEAARKAPALACASDLAAQRATTL